MQGSMRGSGPPLRRQCSSRGHGHGSFNFLVAFWAAGPYSVFRVGCKTASLGRLGPHMASRQWSFTLATASQNVLAVHSIVDRPSSQASGAFQAVQTTT